MVKSVLCVDLGGIGLVENICMCFNKEGRDGGVGRGELRGMLL